MKLSAVVCLSLLLGCESASVAPVETPRLDCLSGQYGADWCWARGRPITVTGDREMGTAFALGAEGTFLRWESESWVAAPVPTRRTLTSGWVGSAANVWVSDDTGSSWHFDGSAWTEVVAPSSIARLMGTPSGALWAVTAGEGGAHGGSSGAQLLRLDGGRWTLAMAPFKYCMGGDYLIAKDGSPWSAGLMCEPRGGGIAVEVRRWDGTAWQLVGAPVPDQSWYPTLHRSGDTIYFNATGYRAWDGFNWIAYDFPGLHYPQGLPLEVMAMWDGLRFTTAPRSTGCEGAFRLDDTHAWCFGGGQIFESRMDRGESWLSQLDDPFAQTQSVARWGTIPTNLWAGGNSWRAWGASPGDVYRVGLGVGSLLEHHDGTRWSTALDTPVTDIHGAAANDVWFATSAAPIHWNGQSFVKVPIPAELSDGEVTGVSALGGGVALARTELTLFLHDGAWRVAYTATPGMRIAAVAGAGPNDIWLVEASRGRSDAAALMHFDGAGWTRVPVTPLSAWGGLSLATRGSDTWLATDGAIHHLGPNGAIAPPIAVDRLSIGADLWVGPDALWLVTDKIARRRALP